MVLTVLHHLSALLALPYREHMLKVQSPYVPVWFTYVSTPCVVRGCCPARSARSIGGDQRVLVGAE